MDQDHAIAAQCQGPIDVLAGNVLCGAVGPQPTAAPESGFAAAWALTH